MTTNNIPTIAEVQEAKLNMDSITEFIQSTMDTLVDQYEGTRRTLQGINSEADAAIAAVGANTIGDYSTNPVLTKANDTAYYSGDNQEYKTKEGVSRPYTCDSTTYPDPNDDPNLQKYNQRDQVTSIAALKARGTETGYTVHVADGLHEDNWYWITGDFSTQVAMDIYNGLFTASDENPSGDLGCWIYLHKGKVKPEWFGAVVSPSTSVIDCQARVQSALELIGYLGGGVLCFSDTENYYRFVATGLSDGLTRHLDLGKHDNVYIEVAEGATLYSEVDARLISIGGGSDNWANNVFSQSGYDITGSYSKGESNSIFLATASEASNFSEGDIALLRTGQVLTSGYVNPFGEFLEVVGSDSGTGEVVFNRMLRGDYALEQYPTGHPDAGTDAPFQLVLATDLVTKNTGIYGKGTIDLQTESAYPILFGNACMYFTFGLGLQLKTNGRLFSLGTSDSLWKDYIAFLDYDAGEGVEAAWPISIDRCNTGTKYENVKAFSRYGVTCHIHEGSQCEIDGLEVHYSNESNRTTGRVISMQNRSRDIAMDNVRIFGGPTSEAEVFQDSDCNGLTIGDNFTISNLMGVETIRAAGDEIYISENVKVASVFLDSDKVGLTQFYKQPVNLKSIEFSGTDSNPVFGLVLGNRLQGWTLPASVLSQLDVVGSAGFKGGQWVLRVKWAQSAGSASGDVRLTSEIRTAKEGVTLAKPSDQQLAVTAVANGDQLTNITEFAFSQFIDDFTVVALRLSRDGANVADTLTEGIVILDAQLFRYQ